MHNSIYDKRVRISDNVIRVLIYLSAFVSVAVLVGIIGLVIVKGAPHLSWQLISTVTSGINNTFGILGNIVNTLYIIVITLLIVTPLGVGGAVYLNEYAKGGKLVRAIEFTIETLSGIPSIIFGLFGMVFFGTALKLGFSILTGALTLALMVLPIITSSTQVALKSVPESYRAGATGMGATKWYMIRTIILPSAMPGIITGIILGIGRIIGESAALLFTAGSSYYLVNDFFGHIFKSGGTLTIQLYLSMTKARYDQAFAVALVLIILVFVLNRITHIIANRMNREKG